MLKLALAAATAATVVLLAPPASATLVYERFAGASDSVVVAARNDGSNSRVVAHGFGPQVSPQGHRIAYLASAKDGPRLYVVGNRGRHRQLLLRRAFASGPLRRMAWSMDERWLAIGDPHGGAWLVDVPQSNAFHIGFGGAEFGGARFDPDDDTVAICHGQERGESDLTAVETDGLTRTTLGSGCQPVWGHPGLAFRRGDAIWLRRNIGAQARRLWRPHRETFYPVDWADDDRLLVFAGSVKNGYRAVAIDLDPKQSTESTSKFSQITAISRDGREVLGQRGGNVVVAGFSGSPKVLAYDAFAPSWTK